jgi:alpha,alpha-trehalose phosphorylase
VKPARATYTLAMGDSLDIDHHGKPIRVTREHPVHCPIPPPPALERPTQPPGREPVRRQVRSGPS